MHQNDSIACIMQVRDMSSWDTCDRVIMPQSSCESDVSCVVAPNTLYRVKSDFCNFCDDKNWTPDWMRVGVRILATCRHDSHDLNWRCTWKYCNWTLTTPSTPSSPITAVFLVRVAALAFFIWLAGMSGESAKIPGVIAAVVPKLEKLVRLQCAVCGRGNHGRHPPQFPRIGRGSL